LGIEPSGLFNEIIDTSTGGETDQSNVLQQIFCHFDRAGSNGSGAAE
jgi:hypothetical protein